MRLSQLPLHQPAYVDSIDWSGLPPSDARRLQEFGFREGASIEALNRGGLFGQGAVACRVGRMTVAMRRNHAEAIEVRTGPERDAGEGQGRS